MNKIYSIVWNEAKQVWMSAAENVSGKGGVPSYVVGSLLAASLLGASSLAQALDANALPTGGQIVAGQGSIAQAGNALTVTQNTQRLIANWSTFNIGQNAGVQFVQPNAASVALNRIQDQNPSQIFGSLRANGQVFLVNPSGITFGPSARVDVGGLVAASLNLSNEHFLAGNYRFENAGNAGVVLNQGNLRTTDGGYVALLSPVVNNQGTITAQKGTVALAAADKVSLDFNGDSLITYTVGQGAVDAQVANEGLIKADGGLVMMTAKAAHDLTSAVVNNTGMIEARTLANQSGRILLISDMEHGETRVGGKLDASAPDGGNGGLIETSAARVMVKDGVQVTTLAPQGKTGEWLIDPVDITISAFGGNITGAAIASALQSTDVTLDTTGAGTCTGAACAGMVAGNGDITINDDINTTADLGAARTLKLIAERNIVLSGGKKIDATLGGNTRALNVIFNADANTDNSGGVTMEYGSSIKSNGGNVVMGGGSCTTAGCSAPAYGTGAAGSAGITLDDNDWGAISISANNGAVWMWGAGPAAGGAGIYLKNATINSGTAGSVYMKGEGIFAGGGMGPPPPENVGAGLFLRTSSIIAGSGGMTLGGTAADGGMDSTRAISFTGDASKAYTTNGGALTVNANQSFSGLYFHTENANDTLGHGTLQNGNMTISYTGAPGAPSGALPNITNPAGNLTVTASGSTQGITDGGGTQTVSGTTSIDANNLSVSLDTGNFTTGTLTISNARAIYVTNGGALTVGNIAGGTDPISIATKTGNLTLTGAIATTSNLDVAVVLNAGKDAAAGTAAGGNIIVSGGTITTGGTGRATLYSGAVGGSTGLTALIGSGSNNFRYNSDETTANYSTALGAGKYAIYREQPTVTVTASNASKNYDGNAYTGGNGVTYGGFVNGDTSAVLGGVLAYGGTSQGAVNAGNYVITPSGYTNGIGYALSYANGTLTINPAALTVITGNLTGAVSKVYDGTTAATLSPANYQLTGWVGGDGATVTKTVGAYDNPNAGGNKTVTVTLVNGDYTPTGATNLGNYSLPATITGAVGSIAQAPLTVTANNDGKTYNGTAYSGGKGVTYSGFVNGETQAVLGGALAYGGNSQGAVNVGSYAIAPQGLNAANYQINYVNGTLTISPAPLILMTIAAQNGSKTYGSEHRFTGQEFSSTGLVSGQTIGSVTLTSAGAPASAAVGSYAIVPSNATGGSFNPANYQITYVNGTLTVLPAPLVVTGNNTSKTYNGLAYSGGNGVSYSGFVNGETAAVLGGTLAYGGSSQGAVNAGSYTIAPQGLTSSNYQISFSNGTLNVAQAPLTVTANNASKTFNGLAYSGGNGVSYSGFVQGETASALGGTLSYAGNSQGAVNPGTYVIAPQGLISQNYQLRFIDGQLSILANTATDSAVTAVTVAATTTASTSSLLGTGSSSATVVAGLGADFWAGGANTIIGGGMSDALTSQLFSSSTSDFGSALPAVMALTSSGTSTIIGGGGADTIIGGSGSDTLNNRTFGTNASSVFGGSTVDILGSGASQSTIVGGTGNDRLIASIGSTISPGGIGANIPPSTPVTSAGSGAFQVSVAPRPSGAGNALVVNAPIPDARVSPGARLSVSIPSGAFSHTDANARVTLSATQANGAPLPSWMSFNSQTGTFEGTPPPGYRGEVVTRVIARDSQGREAVSTFKINIGGVNPTEGSGGTSGQGTGGRSSQDPGGAGGRPSPGQRGG